MVLSVERCWIREPEVPTHHQPFWIVYIYVQSVKNSSDIEMMFGTSNKAINIYGLQIRSLDGKFSLQAEVNKVDRKELLTLENPKCTETVEQFSYLKGVTIQDDSEKPMLPIHLILGTNQCAKIKTRTRPRIGCPGEPVAEYTRLGWTIMSPGKELDLGNMFLT